MRSTIVMLRIADCFNNGWKYGVGMYWATNSVDYRNQEATIVMSPTKDSKCAGTNERKTIKLNKTAYFKDGEYSVKLTQIYSSSKTIKATISTDIPRPGSDLDEDDFEFGGGSTGGSDGFDGDWGDSTLPIGNVRTLYLPDLTGAFASPDSAPTDYRDGFIIEPVTNIQNDGADGDVYIWAGIGFIGEDNIIKFSGNPVKSQEYLSKGQIKTVRTFIQIEETDYHRQQGIGWAFKKEQMYVFILAGHWDTSGVVWDDYMKKPITLYPTETWSDPTEPDNWFGGDDPWKDPADEKDNDDEEDKDSWWDLFKIWLEDLGFGKVIVKKPDLKQHAKDYLYGEIIK